jgi:hypothetical protein
MQTVREYLAKYYIDLDQLASVTGIATGEVQELVERKLAPAPSYVVTADRKLISCVFGTLDGGDAPQGQYFHKQAHVWVARAKQVCDRCGAQEARNDLRAQVQRNFTDALREINDSLVRLPDTFSDSGAPNEARLEERFEETWDALIEGVYSLCVADPSTERSIARKEMLQEHLQDVSASVAAGVALSSSESHRVLDLIQHYADAAMPFAPPEYPRSSRKRLVEDLSRALRARFD